MGEQQADQTLVYAGFWVRCVASLIDSILVFVITLPILLAVYGEQYFESERVIEGPLAFVVSWVLPAIAVVLFWVYRSATPGKMVVSARIVDARTGRRPTPSQCLGRYLGYYVSLIPLGLGFLWIALDRRKQGWHDKLAGTVVVRLSRRRREPATFEDATEALTPGDSQKRGSTVRKEGR